MAIEDVSPTNGEGMTRPVTTMIKDVKCQDIRPGDLIATTTALDSARVLEVRTDLDTTTIVYTANNLEGRLSSSFSNNIKLTRIERASFN